MHLAAEPAVGVRILERRDGGEFRVAVDCAEPALVLLSRIDASGSVGRP